MKAKQRRIVNIVEIIPTIMMATEAYISHGAWDISRDFFDYAYIFAETKKYYIGRWITGLGFTRVLFPKSTTRNATDEEIKYLEKQDVIYKSYW